VSAETWRPILGYEGSYEVSDLGSVRSLPRIVQDKAARPHPVSGRVLTLAWKGPSRYAAVQLCQAGETHQVYVHRLVLEAFAGPRPFPDAVARHLNGNHLDNRAMNLAWGTQQENIADKFRHGTDHNTNKTHCPQDHPYSGDNLIVNTKGHRYCRACREMRNRQRRKKVVPA